MFGYTNEMHFRDMMSNSLQERSKYISGITPGYIENLGLPSNSRTSDAGSSSIRSALVESNTLTPSVKPKPTAKEASTSKEASTNIQHRYEAPFNLFAMNWSLRKDENKRFRLAVASCRDPDQVGQPNHKSQAEMVQIVQLQQEKSSFDVLADFQHSYSANKIVWIPDIQGAYPDLLATSGDYLRVWKVKNGGGQGEKDTIEMAIILQNSHNAMSPDGKQSLPLTSFDWNQADPSILVTCSLDNSCTVWTLETGQAIATNKSMSATVQTQLVAHDNHVYDVAFTHHSSGNRDMFASVGDEGSVRQFDLRNLVQSTVLYQEPHDRPLVRLAYAKQQTNCLAFFAENADQVIVLDIRMPNSPLAHLRGHSGNVNAMSWAAHSENHLVSVGDDQQVLIWDIQQVAARPTAGPILSYTAAGPVNNVAWSELQPEWIAVVHDNSLELLRVE
ncbi:DDB1- and CUL4-associated factor 7 [Hypsibius exemplaris]|uniref:DDB1- and CUL4-associated factor 7 n=1 Tax=Hypsibius exemplaris TaxID=2072580 RepID=A0A1W0W8J9_HYPEX|nr:DDB1- and CUL4-associated factor 7 [Hypsibius exemplaris]